MKRITAAIVAVVSLSAAGTATAQNRWKLDLRAGPAFTTQKLAGADLGTGLGLEATAAYRVMEHLSLYGGWDWHRFTTDASFAGADVDIEETGYAFGLRFEHPIAGSATTALRLRAGGTFNHIEIEDANGDLLEDTGHGLGWEAGAGVALRVSGTWVMTPGVRFRSLTHDFTTGATTTSGTLRYVAVEVGISRTF